MKIILTILAILALPALGQTTHERYILIQQERGESSGNVWRLAWSDRTNDTRWWTWANERGLTNAALTALPCLVDAESWEAVQVTGTVNQAKQDLQAQDDVRRPARKALLDYLAGRTRKQARTQLRDSINAATTVPQLRQAMKDMDKYRELVEDADDERDIQGRKRDQ